MADPNFSAAEAPAKILIAEDSPTQAQLLRHLLEQQGYEVRVAANGRLALEMVPQFQPALVISDVVMPEMDGYRLTHEVRSDPRMADLFITLNTSLSGNFNEAMVKKVGCDRFISKFQPDLLVGVTQERMRQILGV